MQPLSKNIIRAPIANAGEFVQRASSTLLRVIFVSAGIAACGLFAIHLISLPDKWLVASVAGLLAAIAIVVLGNRHLVFVAGLGFSLPLLNLDVTLYHHPELAADYYLAFGLMDIALIAAWANYYLSVPMAERKPLSASALRWLLPGLLILSAFSIHAASIANMALFEWLRLFKMILLVYVTAQCVNDRRALHAAIIAVLVITIGEGLLAMAQQQSGGRLGFEVLGEAEYVMTHDLEAGHSATRVGGTLGHPNHLARFLGFVLPLALAIFVSPMGKWSRRLAALTLLAAGIALITTLSRAAWIGVAAGSALVFYAALKRQELRGMAFRSLRLVMVLIVPMVLVNLNTLITRFSGDDQGSFATRGPMARVAAHVIEDNPVLGVGIGNYRLSLPNYGDPESPFTFQAKVHNVFLLVAAEMGIPSLLLLLAILLVTIRMCFRMMRAQSSQNAILSAGLAGGILAFCIHSMVDYAEISRLPILWFYVGLVWAMMRLEGANPKAQKTNPK